MQAFESARLSLADFRLRSGFASEQSRRKDVAHALATVFWFFGLQHRAGVAAPYGLENLIERKTIGVNSDGERFHSSKWSRYRAGRSEPRTVLPAVETMFPGANACLVCPLWQALTARPLNRRQLEALLQRLAPPAQWVINSHVAELRRGKKPLHQIEKSTAGALERQASLDALAAEILLLRLAHADDRCEAAFEWGRRVQRMLLMVQGDLVAGGVAQALFDLVNERVMPLAQHEELQYGFPAGTFMKLGGLYANAMWHIDGQPYEALSVAERTLVARHILEGKYGYDYLYALNPIRMAAETSAAGAHEQLFATPDVWFFQWAHNMLTVGGHRLPPILDVHTGKDLWATRQGSLDPAQSRATPCGEQFASTKAQG